MKLSKAKYLFPLLGAFFLSGCAIQQTGPQVLTVNASFDSAGAAAMLKAGKNTIAGNAFMRQQGGGVVTCAGSTVRLVPATVYAQSRMELIYGNVRSGVRTSQTAVSFSPNPPEYMELTKTTRCDAQGNFKFDDVSDGDFFIVTQVGWNIGGAQQGGSLMTRAEVRGGKQVNIVVAP